MSPSRWIPSREAVSMWFCTVISLLTKTLFSMITKCEKQKQKVLDHKSNNVVNRFLLKLFKTHIAKYCQNIFSFELPTVCLRAQKTRLFTLVQVG